MKKKMRSFISIIQIILTCIIGSAAILLYNSMRWMFKTWKYLNMDELMYQINAPMEGTNFEMIQDYIQFCIPGVVIILFALVFISIRMYRKESFQLTIFIEVIISIIIIAGTCIYTWNRLDVKNYKKNQGEYSEFVDQNYADPRNVTLTFPQQKRNLIYIFLESMEITYSDKENGGGMKKNYIPELTQLALENQNFNGNSDQLNGARSMWGTTWTVGGMYAETSGLPLVIPINGNDMDQQETFLPKVITIGDILGQEGYNQTLLIGSDATFGGRRTLFSSHGNYEIDDYYYALDSGLIPKDYKVWWGYEDKKLFANAKLKLQSLAADGTPFNLTMLTVDTHFEDGYVCDLCKDDFGDNQYGNVMACSSRQVADFVKWIQQQDFYDNTTIVICGDHPTMDSDFCDEVSSDYERKVYTTIINSAVEPVNASSRREFTTFDLFPTTLASIGVKIDGERLGLGTNLFSNELTLVEKYSVGRMESELKKKSKLLDDFAADVDPESVNQEEQVAEVPAPTAQITVNEWNPETGELPIIVSDIQNVDTDIVSMVAAVWSADDQSDLFWTELQQQDDGTYCLLMHTYLYYYPPGEYKVDIYMIDENGQHILLGHQTFMLQ